MTQLIPLFANSNTETTRTNTTWVDKVTISGASLLNTVEYLVMYCCGGGASATSTAPGMRLEFGGAIHGFTFHRSSSSGTKISARGGQLAGYALITGDGSTDLNLQIRRQYGSGTAYMGGATLIAIPLDNFTRDTDFFDDFAGATSDTAQTDAGASTVSLLEMTETFTAEEWIILACAEIRPGAASGDTSDMWLEVDGTVQKIKARYENRNASDWDSWSFAKVITMLAASQTVRIRIDGIVEGPTQSRRGKIFAFKASLFDQVLNTEDNTIDTVGVNYSTFEDSLSVAYTPNQNEHVVVISNFIPESNQSFRGVIAFLRNDTDGVNFGQYNATLDGPVGMLNSNHTNTRFLTDEISVVKTFKSRRTDENNSTHNQVDEESMIIISMELAAGGATAVSKTTIFKHNVIFAISKTTILKHNVIQAISKTTILKHNLLSAVSKTSILKHDILSAVSKTTILKHNLFAAVSKTTILKHNMAGSVSKTTIFKHQMAGVVAKISIFKHNIAAAVSKTTILKHNILSAVSKSTILKHNLVAAVSKSTIFKHNVIQAIAKTTIFKHSMAGVIAKLTIFKHLVLNPILLLPIIRIDVTTNKINQVNVISLATTRIDVNSQAISKVDVI